VVKLTGYKWALRTPTVDVLVINYNGREIIGKCLEFLVKSDYPRFKVTVVDNGSRDDSVDVVRRSYPHIGIVRLPKNRGYGGGANAGLEKSDAHFVLVMNSDVFLESHCVTELVRLAVTDQRIAFVQPKLYRGFSKVLDSAGAYTLFPLGYDYHLGEQEVDDGRYDRTRVLGYAYGACLLLRRKVASELGKFDEDFFLFHEESDLCWRARVLGYEILSCPQAVAWHSHSYTMRREFVDISYFMERSRILMLLKNYGRSYLAAWLLVESLHALRVLRKRQLALAYLRGWAWNAKNLAKTIRKRKSALPRRAQPEVNVLSVHRGFPCFFRAS
jgi:GT2 family glycosyltransferase